MQQRHGGHRTVAVGSTTERLGTPRNAGTRAAGWFSVAVLVAGSVGALVTYAPTAGALSPGWLDPSFGSAGAARVTGAVAGHARASSLVDSSGSSFIVRNDGASPNVATVTKFTASGTLDTSFGASGVLTLPTGSVALNPQSGPSGTVYLELDDASQHPSIERLTTTGQPDSTFGSSGILDVSTVDPSLAGFGYTVRSDGDVIADLSASSGGSRLAAFTSTGAVDTGFATSGVLTLAMRSLRVGDGVPSVVASSSSSVLLAATPTGTVTPSIYRITGAGAVDTAYGTAGGSPLALGAPDSLTPLPDGSLYVTGEAADASGKLGHVVLTKLDPAGAVDPTFARTGTTTGRNTSCTESVRATAATTTRLYVGVTYNDNRGPCGPVALVWRFTAAGTLDTVFGSGGQQLVTRTGTNAATGVLSGLGVQPDGRLLVTLESGTVSEVAVAASSRAPAGAYVPLPTARLLDTRTGTGATRAAVPANGTLTFVVGGRGGVPTTGASAVVLNVTVAQSTAVGNLTVYPAGQALPRVSNLNFTRSLTISNLVTVVLGTGAYAGKISVHNASAGTSQVAADVLGYYLAGTPSQPGTFAALTPARLLDTRFGLGAPRLPVPRGGVIHLAVAGRGGVPVTGAGAVVLNITVTQAQRGGDVAVFPAGTVRPAVSNLNFPTGATIANLVTVKLGAAGRVDIFNNAGGTVQLIADVAGYYRGGTATLPGTFVPLTPTRDFDTRTLGSPVAARSPLTRTLLATGGVPATGVAAVVLNVTVTGTTGTGYLLVDDPVQDGNVHVEIGSNVTFTAGRTIPDLVIVGVSDGSAEFYNSAATPIEVLADVAGYFRS